MRKPIDGGVCKRCFFGCAGLVALVMARMSVSIGRLVYADQTGQAIAGGEENPAWQTVVFGDPFFYIGAAALLAAMVSLIAWRKAKK